MANHPTVYADDGLLARIDEDRHNQPRSPWFRDAARIKLELREAVESSAMDGELDEDWWKDWLYDAAREELDKREQQRVAEQQDEQEIEA